MIQISFGKCFRKKNKRKTKKKNQPAQPPGLSRHDGLLAWPLSPPREAQPPAPQRGPVSPPRPSRPAQRAPISPFSLRPTAESRPSSYDAWGPLNSAAFPFRQPVSNQTRLGHARSRDARDFLAKRVSRAPIRSLYRLRVAPFPSAPQKRSPRSFTRRSVEFAEAASIPHRGVSPLLPSGPRKVPW